MSALAVRLSSPQTHITRCKRPDFFEIAQEARRLGFALDLKTNGILITPDVAERISALAPLQVDISLLAARTETFDRIAGSARTLERVLRGVRLLQGHGVRVKLNSLLIDLNLREQRLMVDLAASLGVHYEQVLKISPTDNGAAKAELHQLSVAQMAQAMNADRTPFLERTRSDDMRTCSVGLSSCLISPYGIPYPCVELRIAAGDLREQSFISSWRSGPVFAELRERHVFRHLADCRACPIQAYCEGRCAGIAWKEHGDPYCGHSLACWHARARYRHQHPREEIPSTPLLDKAADRGAHGPPGRSVQPMIPIDA